MKCPKCGRDTYSKKWGSCTACGLGGPTPDEVTNKVTEALEVTKRVTAKAQDGSHDYAAVTPHVTKAPEPVTESPEVIVTTTFNVTDAPANIVTGDAPVGRGRPRVYATNAQRQAAYRERKS